MKDEEFLVPDVRRILSFGGTGAFAICVISAVLRGSWKISTKEHHALMPFGERFVAYLYVICVVGVQVCTFTSTELWSPTRGPDDTWEIMWGVTCLFCTLFAVKSMLAKQTYRLDIHHALLFHGFFCFLCVLFLVIHDAMDFVAAPMVLCAVCYCFVLMYPPRHFQVAGHSALCAYDEAEAALLQHGLTIRNTVLQNEALDELRRRNTPFFSERLKNMFCGFFMKEDPPEANLAEHIVLQ